MKTSAIIVGAGSSTRMNKSVSKQLIKLNGKETILHTLLAFQKAETIDEIIVVCREQDTEIIKQLANKNNITKVKAFAKGGNTRQQSVKNGVNLVSNETDFIAIHDGARPLVTPQDINLVIDSAIKHKSSALGVYVKDTIKVVDSNGFISETPNRSSLIAIYTPQVFSLDLYKKAMKQAEECGKDYTDDCQLVESLGEKVFVTIGSPENIKLTTPEDIIIAESFLQSRGE
ncbi:MAG: 2-C-methyl-D-erythritol 4-phosphate cytidylyltransferase [Acutalibacteraceae bacterium]